VPVSRTLIRLLQLSSPALPVGAYTYSQGLEWAVESGTIVDEASTCAWVSDLLKYGMGRYEAPLIARLIQVWMDGDLQTISRLNKEFIATRESSELRAETVQMGYSMTRLARELMDPALTPLITGLAELPEVSFPAAWSGFAASWNIEPTDALTAYLWSWCENQVMAALKAVPLGQASGQRLLMKLTESIPTIAAKALVTPECDWSNLTPAFAIASARHETQYSRLFRS
jgi:urease accessory protein